MGIKSYPLLLFLLLALGLRFFSFFPSVINHDESTYIVLSDTLLAGHTYQVDYIDTKPIGILLFYALLQLLFGKSIFLLRLAAAVVLALTAYFLFRAKLAFGSNFRGSLAAGIIYLFLNSVFTYYGVSPNTETFFNLFTALALWLFLAQKGEGHFFLAGLLLGLGFIIKYVVLFDGFAFGLFLLWRAYRGEQSWRQAIRRIALLAVGAAIPFLCILAYYQSIGQLEAFWFYSFTVSGRYLESKTLIDYLVFFLDFNLRFLPITFFFYYSLFHQKVDAGLRQFTVIWASLVLMGVMLPGKLFGHYFIQWMLPFSLMAGAFFSLPPSALPPWLRWMYRPRISLPILAVVMGALLFFQKKDYLDKKDYPRSVAEYLAPRLREGDRIYTAKDQITYHLLGQLPPVRFVHPSLFWEPQHIEALEVSVEAEVSRLQEKAPRFVVIRRPVDDNRLEPWLASRYSLAQRVGERIEIYVRNGSE